ncbi:hypothetical protein [Flavobacterium sp. UBA7680]|uniref:hypothetical protein n=1 Tax=Flavobacterium sp. UBA7680 TaxID=1946559 RepID=UPI0025C70C57|nr:hypothetical protein [Flavobacterium sp. UBA7680]
MKIKLVLNSRIIHIIFGVLLLTIFSNCSKENNDDVMKQFENDFNDSITKYKAEKFEYKFEALVQQTSYIFDSKIKLLKYSHEPENGFIQSLVFFDSSTDSIQKIIRREITPEWKNNSFKLEDSCDTTYVLFYSPKRKVLKYFDNKVIDSSSNEALLKKDINYIKKMKVDTEKKYNYK